MKNISNKSKKYENYAKKIETIETKQKISKNKIEKKIKKKKLLLFFGWTYIYVCVCANRYCLYG